VSCGEQGGGKAVLEWPGLQLRYGSVVGLASRQAQDL
jgi:hypothetical protein